MYHYKANKGYQSKRSCHFVHLTHSQTYIIIRRNFVTWPSFSRYNVLDRDSAATLVHAFVTSRIWQRTSRQRAKIWTEKLQRVLNAAARVITGTRTFDSGLSHILHHDLHWLDVPQRAIFKLCMTVCKCLHGLAPSCAFRLRMLTDAVNYVRLAEDFWIFLATTCQTMVDVCSVSPVLTSGTHFLSISGNEHQ